MEQKILNRMLLKLIIIFILMYILFDLIDYSVRSNQNYIEMTEKINQIIEDDDNIKDNINALQQDYANIIK